MRSVVMAKLSSPSLPSCVEKIPKVPQQIPAMMACSEPMSGVRFGVVVCMT